MREEIHLRATRESPGHVEWCKREEAQQFSVYRGWTDKFVWVADFAEDNVAEAFCRGVARLEDLTFKNRIGEL